MEIILAKTILSKNNSVNLFRGCSHGCIYCDSRSEVYNNPDFENIKVKENAINIFELELMKKKEKVMISTGAMMDPYMHIEEELQLTRKMLEVIYKYGHGVSLLTKSSLILRDLDLLKKINERSKCIVAMTLTTYDDILCKTLEPNVACTSERVDVLKKLNAAGIETMVWISPILPYINDTDENIEGLLKYCKEAKVKGIITFGLGLTLRKGNREYFYQKLEQDFPGLKERYTQKFGHSYGHGLPHYQRLNQKIKKFCQENELLFEYQEVMAYCNKYPQRVEQLTLF